MAINVANDEFLCPVCNTRHQWRGGIVLASKVSAHQLPDTERIVGWKFCEHHEQQYEAGMVFLVGVDGSHVQAGQHVLEPDDIVRSGSHVALDERTFTEWFEGMPIPDGRILYADESVIFSIATIMENMANPAKTEH